MSNFSLQKDLLIQTYKNEFKGILADRNKAGERKEKADSAFLKLFRVTTSPLIGLLKLTRYMTSLYFLQIPHGEINTDPLLKYVYYQKDLEYEDFQGDYILKEITLDTVVGSLELLLQRRDALIPPDSILNEANAKYGDQFPFIEDLNKIDEDYTPQGLTREYLDSIYLSTEAKTFLIQNALGTHESIEGKKSPFNPLKALDMFKQVIFEECSYNNICPREGKIHQWSKRFRLLYSHVYPVNLVFSKLLHALATGATSRFMVTGQEEYLTRFLIQKEYRSVTLDQIFRESYRLNQGDIYLTILTIENILSKHWLNPDRDRLKISLRLAPITKVFNSGDHFGHWYHLFGTILYSYAKGSVPGNFAALVESVGSMGLSFEGEYQENFVNIYGAYIGAKLRNLVEKESYLPPNFFPSDVYLNPKYYLNLQDEFSRQILDNQERFNNLSN